MAYFDNAATTYPKPECVYAFMNEFYRKSGGNAGRGEHSMSVSAGELIADTRKKIQTLVCEDDIVEKVSEIMMREQIYEILGMLAEREQKVIELRYGLRDGRERTLEEVGNEFGITRERVRQIEAKALGKLRHPSRSQKLRDYIDYTSTSNGGDE